MVNLSIGVTAAHPAVELLLRQIGAAFQPLASPQAAADSPVLIVTAPPDGPMREAIREHLRRGRALLCEAKIAAHMWSLPLANRRIDYISARDDTLLGTLPLTDLHLRTAVVSDSRFGLDPSGRATIAEAEIEGGSAIILPTGIFDSLLRHQAARKNFPAAAGLRFPSERVSRVSKGGVRRIVARCLQQLFHHQGLPFVSLSPFPAGADGWFGFRIDTDFCQPAEVDTLYNLLQEFRIPATWFVETRTCEEWIDAFSRLQDQEIALHCYRHRVFSSAKENRQDIDKGLSLLRGAGLSPRGYAAPGGDWNPALAAALEDTGFSYSSEFSLDYDNFPFYPWLGERFSSVMQIPIHPVSVGRLRWARHTPDTMAAYYRQRIDEAAALQEPLILYHHPGQGMLDVFREVFRIVRERGWQVSALDEFNRHWTARHQAGWAPRWVDGMVQFNADPVCGEFETTLVYPGGIAIRRALSGQEADHPREAEIAKVPLPPQPDPRLLRRYTKQMLVHDLTWRYSRWKQ